MSEHRAEEVRQPAYWPAIVAALIAIGAGIYLLISHAVASDSIFNPLLHGAGAYFIARGIFMGWSGARMVEERSATLRSARCPLCKEPIHREALVCPHCRHPLQAPPGPPPPERS